MEAGGEFECNGFVSEAAATRPRVVDEDAPHHGAGDTKDLWAINGWRALRVETKKGLVDERSGLEGVVGALSTQVEAGEPFELDIEFVEAICGDQQLSRPEE